MIVEQVGICGRVAAYQMFEAGLEFDAVQNALNEIPQIMEGYYLADDIADFIRNS